jgi:DNA-binding HxlR family transcriptional regulator
MSRRQRTHGTTRQPRTTHRATASVTIDPRVVELFHHRWTVPLLAELHASRGGRVVDLAHQLDASRPAIRSTLDVAIEQGWVQRDPGAGHPLRPEYALTPAGRSIAPVCRSLLSQLETRDLIEVGLRKWSMPVLHAVDRSRWRFGELRRKLAVITDRALSTTLKQLLDAELIVREIADAYPPVAVYAAHPHARPILRVLRRL